MIVMDQTTVSTQKTKKKFSIVRKHHATVEEFNVWYLRTGGWVVPVIAIMTFTRVFETLQKSDSPAAQKILRFAKRSQ